MNPILRLSVRLAFIVGFLSISFAQQFNPSLYQSMRWRMIGPHRGGRTVGAVGVPGQPNVFYIGVNNGGVWKTSDYGRTWAPIFDDQPTGSIGTIALAPSNPDFIYVGSGEGLHRPDLSTGDGVYKSTDAGKTWQYLGLRDGQQIGAIIVDPRDPNRVFVAVLGHPYGANEERGIFRSNDGGRSWQKVLYKDENTGAIALAFHPTNPEVIYADLWASREGPWENGSWQGNGSGLYRSTDGGATWRQLTKGLPTVEQGLGRIGFCGVPGDSNRMYAVVDAPQLGGVYRSDDAGESWQRVNADTRLWGRGYDFAEVKADPKNKNIVYVANIATYRSTDAGQTFTAWKGAPGGDDYHTIWINPDNPQTILLASDQGATLTVNSGQTWSSWYNQPTAQFYHVITDNQFPYWVYGGQQESGSVGIASRGNDGQITFREWNPVGVEEYGYVAPDPLNANIIYGGKITRYDKATGQAQNIAPEAIRSGKYRFLRTAPVIFSPINPKLLYYAGNVLFKTLNGGQSWDVISPDLSCERPEVPENIGIFRTPELASQPRRGVIYTVAPSHQDVNSIWAGTDDGLIHITRDGGKTWKNVTPPALTSWSKVSIIDASHFDSQTAYAAINRFRLDDLRPHIYRTHDGGNTWQEIVKGLPDNAPVNAVREDPARKGLLFCGTELAVYVSFNDGENWQPLRLNMPATSIRDLVVHNDDIVVGTHGRSFWILDDITPLRQINDRIAEADVFLFNPQVAYRVRRNNNTDTPLPPEEPAGKNPPDGAIINYYLRSKPLEPLTLEIFDSSNKLVRRFSSADVPEPVNERELSLPTYWIRPPQVLSAESGMQRFVWDLHFPPPEGERPDYPISAIYRDTPRYPLGPTILPGTCSVKLTVGGKSTVQPLTVKMDPRVKTPSKDLAKLFASSVRAYEGMRYVRETLLRTGKLRAQIKNLQGGVSTGALSDSLTALDQRIATIDGSSGTPRSGTPLRASGAPVLTFARLNGELHSLLNLFEESDATPTTQALAGSDATQKHLTRLLAAWNEVRTKDVRALNEQLRRVNLPPLMVE